MCTVTFVPLSSSDFILTSNRDETPLRATLPPEVYEEKGTTMCYPKDKLAGGTWIGVSEHKRLVCLLNGAFLKHKRTPPYQKSRGLIVKELLATTDVTEWATNVELMGVEPFTIVCVEWSKASVLFEFVWDGNKKHFSQKSQSPQIWSSAPLYTPEMKEERHQWFADFIKKTAHFSMDTMFQFHGNTSQGDPANAICMKREFVQTVSITSIEKRNNTLTLVYKDLISNTEKKLSL